MPASRRSRKPSRISHQQSWIWGRHAVLEAIRSDRWTPCEIQSVAELPPEILKELRQFCDERDVLSSVVSSDRLEQLVHTPAHQGMIAKMPEYNYLPLDELIDDSHSDKLYLVLDSIQDAFNFGACLRCGEVLGVEAVLVGERDQCGMTSQAVRSSAGAVHHLPIFRTSDLTGALVRLQAQHVQLVAASEKGDRTIGECDFGRSTAIVLGNENTGIADERLALCTVHARIPQAGRVGSLNVAVAAGIMLYEAFRQRTSTESHWENDSEQT
jgi:23S rRNA (guanosine2251-2'-O)-methyltransferase